MARKVIDPRIEPITINLLHDHGVKLPSRYLHGYSQIGATFSLGQKRFFFQWIVVNRGISRLRDWMLSLKCDTCVNSSSRLSYITKEAEDREAHYKCTFLNITQLLHSWVYSNWGYLHSPALDQASQTHSIDWEMVIRSTPYGGAIHTWQFLPW